MIVSVTITDSRETEISDALRSVVDRVDRVLLLDTGITDCTVERAREVAGEKLVVAKHEWVDFSSARNAGLEHARALGAEWILIVDSDERIDFGRLDLRAALARVQSDAVEIFTDDGHQRYPKTKLVRASADAYFEGPTHEVLLVGSKETLGGASFSELQKSWETYISKCKRDVELLREYLKRRPNDPRWWYYLGASYEGTGDRERAIEAFKECSKRRRFGEEAAWSAYKQAEQFFILGRYEETLEVAASGLAMEATFFECAWLASVAAFRLGRNEQAIAWARMAESTGLYKGCGVRRRYFQKMEAAYELPYDVLRFALPEGAERKQAEIDFHRAKIARLGASDGGLERLSITRNVIARYEAREMLRPPMLSELCPSARGEKIQFDPPNGWQPMNPSVCRHNGELWCVVRTVNYSLDKGRYIINDPNGVVRTENYLGRLENNSLVDARLIRDLDTSERKPSRIVGYEDIRLVSIDGVLAGSSTVCDVDPNRRMIARLWLEGGDVVRAEVKDTNQPCEKNWMPLELNGELAWIYSLDPTAILPGPLNRCPFSLEHLRGGASIALEDGYLCVTHEVIESDSGRIYLHRFVRLDGAFNVTSVSKTWVFNHHGIEFCAGLALDGAHLVLTYGVEDREAWIMRMPASDLANLEWFKPETEEKATEEKPNPEKEERFRLVVVNSPHDRCGVREYGLQLNRSFAQAEDVELLSYTFDDISVSAMSKADVILVHFEDGVVPQHFYPKLEAARRHGPCVVLCCHRFEVGHAEALAPLVDHFVLHRHYDNAPPNSTFIPLGCPVYTPIESRSKIRERLGLPVDELVVTSLGFLAPWKRWPEVVEATAKELGQSAFLRIHTAIPFSTTVEPLHEMTRVRAALSWGRGKHSTEFLAERDLLDLVHASDLGFVFHPIHTGSVSAATKQFVSARCPLIVTSSSHASDINDGVLRVDSFEPRDLAKGIRRAVEDNELRAHLAEGMSAEYARLNMDEVATRYLELFEEIAQ